MSDSKKPSAGRKAITGPELPVPEYAPKYFSPGILAGGWLFCSGAMPTDYQNAVDEVGYTDPDALHRPDAYDNARLRQQSHAVLQRLQKLFAASGGDLRTDTIRVEQFFRSPHPTQRESLFLPTLRREMSISMKPDHHQWVLVSLTYPSKAWICRLT